MLKTIPQKRPVHTQRNKSVSPSAHRLATIINRSVFRVSRQHENEKRIHSQSLLIFVFQGHLKPGSSHTCEMIIAELVCVI